MNILADEQLNVILRKNKNHHIQINDLRIIAETQSKATARDIIQILSDWMSTTRAGGFSAKYPDYGDCLSVEQYILRRSNGYTLCAE